MNSRYLILLILIAFSACKERSRISVTLQRDIAFNFLGYSGAQLSGVLVTDSVELLYLGNVETAKKVDFFKTNGDRFASVSLEEVLKNGIHIEAIYAQSLDTIVLKSAYDNIIYIIDRKGAVWKTVKIPGNFDDYTSFEATASFSANTFVAGSEIVLHCAPTFPAKPGIGFEEGLNIQATQSRRKPYFIATENLYVDSPKWRFMNPGFYARFIPSGKISVEPAMYSTFKSKICLFSVYNDTLYLLSTTAGNIEQAIKIKSEYTAIGAKPLFIQRNVSDSLNLIAETSGLIINVTYDKYREFYYVSVRHEVPINSSKKDKANFSPWSLIVYDKQLNFLGEIEMERGKYNPGDLFVVKEGVLLHYNNKELLSNSVKFDLLHVKNN